VKLPGLGLVIVAAGSSRRMGGVDKVWAHLDDHPVVWHSLTRLAPRVEYVVLVVHESRLQEAAAFQSRLPDLRIVPGGVNRQQSVARGLCALPDVDMVAVHDAARPLVPVCLLETGVDLLALCDGAVPVVPLHDTVKRIDGDGNVLSTIDREQLRAVQTPQIFWTEVLGRAHRQAEQRGFAGTDDARLLEVAGYRVRAFPGSTSNFKITTVGDLERARLLLEQERGEEPGGQAQQPRPGTGA